MKLRCIFPFTLETTNYFAERVLRKRPYIRLEWCRDALSNYVKKEKQKDGRIRYWIFREEVGKYLRVVTLENEKTIHNAFFDRNFTG